MLKAEIVPQLDRLIADGERIVLSYSGNGMLVGERCHLSEQVLWSFRTRAAAALERIAGKSSEFFRHLPPLPKHGQLALAGEVISGTVGVLQALRTAVDSGELTRLEQRVRANVEDDFLEQAASLLESRYPAASMVLIGGVLEDRLRTIVTARKLTWPGAGSLSKYNDALQRADVYDQPTWRRIQAVTDLRNAAAHGGEETAKVCRDDVEDSLKYVRRFLTEYSS